MILYTDGLTDVLLAPDDKLFDLEHLQSVLLAHSSIPLADMCAATFADLTAYRGTVEQYDDMTMLSVKVKEVKQPSF